MKEENRLEKNRQTKLPMEHPIFQFLTFSMLLYVDGELQTGEVDLKGLVKEAHTWQVIAACTVHSAIPLLVVAWVTGFKIRPGYHFTPRRNPIAPLEVVSYGTLTQSVPQLATQ